MPVSVIGQVIFLGLMAAVTRAGYKRSFYKDITKLQKRARPTYER